MHRFPACLLLPLLLAACTASDDDRPKAVSPSLVAEGWIEAGGFPVVMLTRSFPVSTDFQDMSDLSDYLVRWAKVTVSDGQDSAVLTGKYDEAYYPPYIYTTGQLRGRAGQTYTLTVEYRGERLTAQTTIPPDAPAGCTFSVSPCAHSDTLFQVTARFTDNPATKDYYQLFSRVGTQWKMYQAAYLGSIDDAMLMPGQATTVPVYRGHRMDDEFYTPYYLWSDTISVKLARIDATSYHIWDSYTKELSLSGNMFLSTASGAATNIRGGYGYWCGYNAVTRHIAIRDSVSAPLLPRQAGH